MPARKLAEDAVDEPIAEAPVFFSDFVVPDGWPLDSLGKPLPPSCVTSTRQLDGSVVFERA